MMKRIKYLLITSLIFTAEFAYAQEFRQFTILSPEQTGINFSNEIVETEDLFFYKYEYLYNGGGVSLGDINNDGLADIYFSSTLGSNRLYLNLGNMQFRDITASANVDGGAGIKSGVNFVDINNDGFLDIFVSKSGPTSPEQRQKVLYINNGDLTFTDKATEYGLNDASFTTQTYFFDYDKDGDLDAFMVNHPADFSNAVLIPAKIVNGKRVYAEDTTRTFVSNRLYRNDGNKFRDVTAGAGLLSHAFGLSASIYDFNRDGWPDIYVANDFNKPDYIYINDRSGKFENRLKDYLGHVSLSSMGSDINDINNDGHEDLFVVDMAIEDPVRQKQLFVQNLNYDKFQLLLDFDLFYQYPRNVLQLNNGNGGFGDIAYYSGMAQTDWSWAPLIADYDNDGWKDVFVSNGYLRDVTDWDYKVFVLDSIKNLMARGQSVSLAEWFRRIPSVRINNYFYKNAGSLKFENTSNTWLEQKPSFSNGAAYADLDNDGDLDIVVNNINDPAFVYRNNNELRGNSFVRFQFFKDNTSRQHIYGAEVRLFFDDGSNQFQRFDPQRGYMGTMEHSLHFGFGKERRIEGASIKFPSGKEIIMMNPEPNKTHILYESDATVKQTMPVGPAMFVKVNTQSVFPYAHRENNFIDFKREPLIPYKCSRKGPFVSRADINNDGNEEVYIGGSAGNPGVMMTQQKDGSWKQKTIPAFVTDRAFEDGGSVFFDADNDGDKDLFVVSGGSQFEQGSSLYQDRLYINDGRGNFSKSTGRLPVETENGSVVITLDFDGDGDLDLFVGGGVKPGRFPHHDSNLLLENRSGKFIHHTSPAIQQTGIVNSAAWADMTGDGKNELILAGEWMAPQLYTFNGNDFQSLDFRLKWNEKEYKLNELKGWWNIVVPADVDKDGDLDLVMGNRGLNSKITATIDQPATIYGKDFDKNGSYDALLGYYIEGKLYPMYHRDQLVDQMPMMRKRFLRYRNYAGTGMDEIFTEAQKQGMEKFTAGVFESGVLINEGNSTFRFMPFDENAQLSLINDMLIADYDQDGHTDIIAVGNSYDPDVSTGNYDAAATVVLKGEGNGRFKVVGPSETGLPTTAEIRRIVSDQKNNRLILFQNNGSPMIYRSTKSRAF